MLADSQVWSQCGPESGQLHIEVICNQTHRLIHKKICKTFIHVLFDILLFDPTNPSIGKIASMKSAREFSPGSTFSEGAWRGFCSGIPSIAEDRMLGISVASAVLETSLAVHSPGWTPAEGLSFHTRLFC